jgi:hypothetical protein
LLRVRRSTHGRSGSKDLRPTLLQAAERRREKERAAQRSQPPAPVATAVQVVRAPQAGAKRPRPDDWRHVAAVVGTIIAAGDGVKVALRVDGVRLTVSRRG